MGNELAQRDEGREVLKTLIGMVPMLRTVGRCLVAIGDALQSALPELAADQLERELEAPPVTLSLQGVDVPRTRVLDHVQVERSE